MSPSKTIAAEAAARSIATANGYTADDAQGLEVDVSVSYANLADTVQVDVTKPHRNNFAGVMGMTEWPVSVTATALSTGHPNGANGAMPLLFNAEAFPGAICDEEAGGCVPEVYQLPGGGNEDVPQDATQFNWTIFCTASGNPCNANSNGVRALIDGNGASTTVNLNDDIGPLNAGSHTTLFIGARAAYRRAPSRSRSSPTRGTWSASPTSSSSASKAAARRSSAATSSHRSMPSSSSINPTGGIGVARHRRLHHQADQLVHTAGDQSSRYASGRRLARTGI